MAVDDDDARLAARALREAWPVSPEMRAELVKQLYGIATSTDPKVRPREKAAATRAIFAASRHNVEAVRAAAAVTDIDALLARLDSIERQLDEREDDD
jgi:hypothetical protein